MRASFLITLLLASLSLPLSVQAAQPYQTTISHAGDAQALTLSDAIARAMQANPELAVASREREAITGVQVQAAVRPNPSISTFVEDTRTATRQTTVQINQPLELGNKRAARISAADARYDLAAAELVRKRSDVRAAVMAAFYEVLVAQERETLTASTLELAQGVRDAASKRVQAGKISPVEETKSRLAESNVRIELELARSQLNASRKRLSALWGQDTPDYSRVEGEIEHLPVIAGLESLTRQLEQAPAIQRARLEIEQRNAVVGVERSKRVPDLTLSVGARRDEEMGLNQAVLGLSIPIPVFDRNQGNLQEALIRTDKARDELLALQVQQTALLQSAYERYLAARQESTTLQDGILPDARQNYDAAVRGFEFGKFGFLDVLDAQRTLFQARFQYLNALQRAHQSIAELTGLLGELPANDLAVVDQPARVSHQE
ncbi:TolC family protein [Pseudomethylobacillus aquaticus]|uniref:TolC family protein n=1 Tax=Pseudomethylobacillus aquaticus TaxID=2676064 RepID=A0A3N0V5K5_9PROT|nr:TolC family protein [Pseudomethylobacillus aquaticus]ROH88090.1 TolC family protein [Pseudomethylobacillus aquaticus]